MLMSMLAVVTGAALGALCRWSLGLIMNAWYPALPPGTLVANVVGGYLAGLALPLLLAHPELPAAWRLFVITGFLGGLTTFSAFSLEVATLLQQGRLLVAAGGVALHVGGSLAATLAGFATVALLRR
ncbi:fluoride efflux transporter CrcB [Rubrivivax albus]|uniref:Fluoride-specific ion channel FluC n=1 Tax=Rubrivivax albus TaxID=2499835 RepID=A0A3S2TPJ0_9BURK|nr:fluoride efflux transporter CrcB [Rubrivivax albus]RVT53979.1 fluoride efflux transporter CrcB [Rubrivivax albus]